MRSRLYAPQSLPEELTVAGVGWLWISGGGVGTGADGTEFVFTTGGGAGASAGTVRVAGAVVTSPGIGKKLLPSFSAGQFWVNHNPASTAAIPVTPICFALWVPISQDYRLQYGNST